MKVLTDTNTCSGPRFYFVPYGPGNRSLIDHFIIYETFSKHIVSCASIDDSTLNVSRHHPIVVQLTVSQTSKNTYVHEKYSRTRYNWKCQANNDSYKSYLSNILIEDNIDFNDVDSALDTIINCMSQAAESTIKKNVHINLI